MRRCVKIVIANPTDETFSLRRIRETGQALVHVTLQAGGKEVMISERRDHEKYFSL